MSADEPRWRWLSTREVHRGRVRIDADEVELPGGARTVHEVDRSAPFSVSTLVVLGGDVVLARQYRYPIDRWILDLPGGAGDPGEAPADAARRELEEELGLIADELTPLHVFATNPGRSVGKTHVFLATAVRRGHAATHDPAERVRSVRMPLAELDRLIAEGEILDPTLLVARTMAAAKGLLPPVGI
ncbi:NUDIX hydrolase [Microbacterium sp. NPDC056052]|uniref:NUDIX hydrolase n=1 Tax=Microbacterium sp. NPDC056052 TaxID=3345695 RepID=UPI0035DE70CC